MNENADQNSNKLPDWNDLTEEQKQRLIKIWPDFEQRMGELKQELKEAISNAFGVSLESTPQPVEVKKPKIWKRLAGWIESHWLFRLQIRIRLQVLRLYTDEYDTYVAYSSEDADKAYEEFVGDPRDEEGYDHWTAIPLFCNVKIRSEEKLDHYPLYAKIAHEKDEDVIDAPAWAWVLDNGRGFLCSTEY